MTVTQSWRPARSPGRRGDSTESSYMVVTPAARRFVLWIDAVGGVLVYLDDQITIGQAGPGNHVDLAVQGDLSRRHAKLTRHGEGYVLTPLQRCTVGGRTLEGPTTLSDGDEFALGASVRMRFRKPHALSVSARLESVSRHRTNPPVDAVVLMAESCVLGPSPDAHVVCRGWSSELVLFRRGEQLCCRAASPFLLNGSSVKGLGVLAPGTRVVGEDFSFSVEHA